MIYAYGTVANPSVNVILQGKGSSSNAFIHLFQDSTEKSQYGYYDASNEVLFDSQETTKLTITAGSSVTPSTATGALTLETGGSTSANSGSITVQSGNTVTSGDSGTITIQTGTVAGTGDTRGDIDLLARDISFSSRGCSGSIFASTSGSTLYF